MYVTYTYVTYVANSPLRVWEALTDPDLTAHYEGHSNISDWEVGSRLTMTFGSPGDSQPAQGPTKLIFEIEPYHEIVRLTVMHENPADSDALDAVSRGWSAACANLKSLLEDQPGAAAGEVGVPTAPRPGQMARNDLRSTKS